MKFEYILTYWRNFKHFITTIPTRRMIAIEWHTECCNVQKVEFYLLWFVLTFSKKKDFNSNYWRRFFFLFLSFLLFVHSLFSFDFFHTRQIESCKFNTRSWSVHVQLFVFVYLSVITKRASLHSIPMYFSTFQMLPSDCYHPTGAWLWVVLVARHHCTLLSSTFQYFGGEAHCALNCDQHLSDKKLVFCTYRTHIVRYIDCKYIHL